MKNRRFLAAVYAYAHDRLTLAQVTAVGRPSPQDVLIPKWFSAGRSGIREYERMIQEVARRIRAGRIPVTDDIYREHPDVLRVEIPAYSGTWRFSEFEALPPELNPLTVRRDSFDEDDIQDFVKDPRILACIHAYCLGLMNFEETHTRMFGNPGYLPGTLSNWALLGIAFAVCDRIRDGRLAVPPSLRDEYPFAYKPQVDFGPHGGGPRGTKQDLGSPEASGRDGARGRRK